MPPTGTRYRPIQFTFAATADSTFSDIICILLLAWTWHDIGGYINNYVFVFAGNFPYTCLCVDRRDICRDVCVCVRA